MAIGAKPTTAASYYADVTTACERTLLTLLGAFGSLKGTLRLVGGLVPRYLTPEAPPDVPAHAGTSDVDVVLNIQVIAQGVTFRHKGAGYFEQCDVRRQRPSGVYANLVVSCDARHSDQAPQTLRILPTNRKVAHNADWKK